MISGGRFNFLDIQVAAFGRSPTDGKAPSTVAVSTFGVAERGSKIGNFHEVGEILGRPFYAFKVKGLVSKIEL